jgi:hypothetical protein
MKKAQQHSWAFFYFLEYGFPLGCFAAVGNDKRHFP